MHIYDASSHPQLHVVIDGITGCDIAGECFNDECQQNGTHTYGHADTCHVGCTIC